MGAARQSSRVRCLFRDRGRRICRRPRPLARASAISPWRLIRVIGFRAPTRSRQLATVGRVSRAPAGESHVEGMALPGAAQPVRLAGMTQNLRRVLALLPVFVSSALFATEDLGKL